MRKITLGLFASIIFIAGCRSGSREAIITKKHIHENRCEILLTTRLFTDEVSEVMSKEECDQFQEGELVTFEKLFPSERVRIYKKEIRDLTLD